MDDVAKRLHAALLRVIPYLDRLPESAAEQVREAMEAWEKERKKP